MKAFIETYEKLNWIEYGRDCGINKPWQFYRYCFDRLRGEIAWKFMNCPIKRMTLEYKKMQSKNLRYSLNANSFTEWWRNFKVEYQSSEDTESHGMEPHMSHLIDNKHIKTPNFYRDSHVCLNRKHYKRNSISDFTCICIRHTVLSICAYSSRSLLVDEEISQRQDR